MDDAELDWQFDACAVDEIPDVHLGKARALSGADAHEEPGTLLSHLVASSRYKQLLDLFDRGDAPGRFDLPIDDQTGCHQDLKLDDVLDLGDFLDLRLDAEFLNSPFGVCREFMASLTSGSQDLNVGHRFSFH
jgi:hypothetical protein